MIIPAAVALSLRCRCHCLMQYKQVQSNCSSCLSTLICQIFQSLCFKATANDWQLSRLSAERARRRPNGGLMEELGIQPVSTYGNIFFQACRLFHLATCSHCHGEGARYIIHVGLCCRAAPLQKPDMCRCHQHSKTSVDQTTIYLYRASAVHKVMLAWQHGWMSCWRLITCQLHRKAIRQESLVSAA